MIADLARGWEEIHKLRRGFDRYTRRYEMQSRTKRGRVMEFRLVYDEKTAEDDGGAQYLHRGMANRNFKQVFRLADHVKVADARLENGLLSVQLVREVPEELKPRRIAVSSSASTQSADDVAPANAISQDIKPQRKAA